jgi:XRE family transcriptional regulator, regulator of sulfur utilization
MMIENKKIMNLGKAIKELRKQKELSQSQLAELVEISQTSLSQIESGQKRPSSKNLKKISSVLEISEPMLFILATEKEDIPEEKKHLYDILYPSIEGLVKQLIG